MKTIQVPLSVSGIKKLLKEVSSYEVWLKERTGIFIGRLAEEGLSIASAKFSQAVYDGTNDVSVSVEQREGNAKAIVAIGASVLFIEFGTGVTYPDNHPEAHELGMTRGTYGKGHGKQSSWGYYGEPGTNGLVKEKPNGTTVVITRGNPANMFMYETVKELEARVYTLAKEVFV